MKFISKEQNKKSLGKDLNIFLFYFFLMNFFDESILICKDLRAFVSSL